MLEIPKQPAKTTTPKTTKSKANPQQQKNTAQKLINFLSGYNLKNEKIMPDDNFARLSNYIAALIDNGTLPANIQPIPQTGVSSEYLRYTFYLIHKELYTTRPIRPEWIDLLHAVFVQFNNSEKETTRKKFSKKPDHYDSDIATFTKKKK